MEVNVKQALKIFFPKSSFEMIYFEAFANALDADATEFNIDILYNDPTDIKSLQLKISDNGVGFNNKRFSKFSKLLDVEEQSHKGLGRLVYLCYFDNVHIESIYESSKKRTFDFKENFDSKSEVVEISSSNNGSTFELSGFNGKKLAKNYYINPTYIKRALLEQFYMKLYLAKINNKIIKINISAKTKGEIANKETFDTSEITDFKTELIDNPDDFFNKIELYYRVQPIDSNKSSIITALTIDDRTHKVDIISNENLPQGYEMIFLLMSESFKGNIDQSRQNLTFEENELNHIKLIFRKAIAQVINKQFPKILKIQKERRKQLSDIYPHLDGYFDTDDIGYSSQNDVLKKAQEKFFRDQKEILCAEELDEEQFQKSLDLSARALAEYILFRQNTIKKLKEITSENTEKEIHNIIAPQRSDFHHSDLMKDLFKNNVWILDDKFMSYSTVLSEAEMTRVISEITDNQVYEKNIDRPDISIFFSGNPTELNKKVDVVIVELKRRGLNGEMNSVVEFQLAKRARQLSSLYGNRIQRMWFYGVVEFDEEYEMSLINDDYHTLFSTGKIYFRSKEVYTDLERTNKIIQNTYILDYQALVDDADCRNSTFLRVLRDRFSHNNE